MSRTLKKDRTEYEKPGQAGLGTAQLKDTMGSPTGETEHETQAGGWAGTDDATSTAPCDQTGNPPVAEEEKPFHTIARDLEDSIQLDEEQQEQRAIDSDETSESVERAEESANIRKHTRLASKVRAARKK